jgi:hypothetical protein
MISRNIQISFKIIRIDRCELIGIQVPEKYKENFKVSRLRPFVMFSLFQ